MTIKRKKKEIKALVKSMLKISNKEMINKIDKLLNSGAIDVDSWETDSMPMILPKCIVTALLQDESMQYDLRGTSFEKTAKKEIENIKAFI